VVTKMIARQIEREALRVLAVDDEPALCKVVARLLGVEGHTVIVAYSVEEAIDELERGPFDVVVADLGLGPASELTGWDLANHVNEHCPGTRFVLATGWGPQITPAEARARGVETIIAKPYKLAELRDVVVGVR
jgi:CheY-like chemotaxis protein